MTRPPRLLGAVLAGGEGRRFGGPKAGARAGGMSLLERTVAVLRAVVEDVVVVSADPMAEPPATLVPDRVRGMGPLGGLDAALRHARSCGYDGILAVACDLPLLTPAILEAVIEGLGEHAAAAPARDGGGVEPLCAAYRVGVLEVVERRLQEPDRSLHALFRDVGGHVLPPVAADAGNPFLNVNTLEELARAHEALAAGGDR